MVAHRRGEEKGKVEGAEGRGEKEKEEKKKEQESE